MIALQEQLLWPLEELLSIGREVRKTRALFTRVFEYLDKPVEIKETADAVTFDKSQMRGAVRVENVSFSYPESEKPTLSEISIDVPAGSSVAIVGSTGSGKTTLGYLLARLYDVESGSIRYDGIDIRDLSFDTLADMLGVVTQEPYLLYASVAENLRFAKPDATDEELINAAKIAQIHDSLAALPEGYDTIVGDRGYRFSGGEKQRLALARTILRNPPIHDSLAALPEGYDTIVGDRGYRFSGGEKQRLALARTILRNPPVLLLDEATSALDTKTERAMEAALANLSKDRTTITIAHRLSTIRRADQI
uniref:ABC transporter domain-containing protein n=1 Tax=Parastrongyloides trichosuri TaxID=131310 RepID=A0A0N5A613_PARTI